VRGSRTVGEALEAMVCEQPRFSSNGRMWLRPCGEQVELCQAFMNKFDRSDPGWQQANHYLLMLMLDVIRLGADSTWRPTRVRLQTAVSPVLRDAELLAGARLTFGQPVTTISLAPRLLGAPLPPPEVEVQMTEERIETWRESGPAGDCVASIVQAVEMLSSDDFPDIHETARFLGVSVRTLQRYLAEAGITHESLVGRVRFSMAAAVLEETDTKILDIALDLGYSDHAHFTRAFSRWAGCSPQEYRRRCRRRPAVPTRADAGGTGRL